MKKQEIAAVELLMSKKTCMKHLQNVQTLYPKFDGVMSDSMDARLTYRLYVNELDKKDHTKAIKRKLQALEVICKDKRVRIRATKGELFDQYLQAHPFLMKLKPILASSREQVEA